MYENSRIWRYGGSISSQRDSVASCCYSSPILVTLMMKAICSSETPLFTRTTRRNITDDGILHSHRRENLIPYITLTVCVLWRRRNVSPAKYELGFYIPEDGILHSHCNENFKYCIALTG
jgi:hypothetical protein